MIAKTKRAEGGRGGLELVLINRNCYRKHDGDLRKATEFLAQHYSKDKALPYKEAKGALEDSANQAYSWMVAKKEGEVVGVVVYDVWDVPKSPTNPEPDGKNHYTSLFYVKAVKGYDDAIEGVVNEAIEAAKKYSKEKGRRNIGILTDEGSHSPSVIKKLAKEYGGGYVGKIGVPTLETIPEEEYKERNFKAEDYEKLVVIPFGRMWGKKLLQRVASSWLDQGFNQFSPGEKGYTPLGSAEFFRDFVRQINEKPGRYKPMPITWK